MSTRVGAAFDKTTGHRIPTATTDSFVKHYFAQNELARCRVLDAGCRIGDYSAALLRHGAEFVVGIDVSRSAVRVARATYTDPRLDFQAMNVANLSAFEAGSFDVALCSSTLSYLSPGDAERAVRELCRVLSPGGVLLALVVKRPNRGVDALVRMVAWMPGSFQWILAKSSRFLPGFLANRTVGRSVDQNRFEYLMWGLQGLRFDADFSELEPGRTRTVETMDCSEKTLVSYKCRVGPEGRFVAAGDC